MVSPLRVGEDMKCPQNPHLTADAPIGSEQPGHFFIAPGDCELASGACLGGEITSAKMRPNGPRNNPTKNHLIPLRPLLDAATDVTTPNRIQIVTHSILISLRAWQ